MRLKPSEFISCSTAAAGKLALAAVLLLPLASVQARDPLYGVLDNDALLACEGIKWSSEFNAAGDCYSRLFQDLSQAPQIRAEAVWASGDLRTANSLFQTAVETAPEDPLVRLRWGELFLETYQYQEALDLFDEALNLDPNNAWAHVGAAAALQGGGGGEGIAAHLDAVQENFAAPPGAVLRVQIMQLRRRMEQDQYQEAEELLEEIRELAEDENLATMEVSALEAALSFLQREDPAPFIQASLDESPAYGDAYAIPGYFATIVRRYQESAEFYQQAVRIQPNHWVAHMELGQNLLRLNRISEGMAHVQTAYEGDPFNPKVINTLRLLDTFTQDFVTVSYPDPPTDGIPELNLRMHRDERDILKYYARELAEESIDTFSERYQFEPTQPITVELFPNHEDFVVRSIGMPGVGILGVTFGYLFAMDSPSGHPDESYHWGTTLWHEMAHVFTLKATNHFVPRWFSEGISVFEEWNTGPIPGRKIPTNVLQAMAEGRFLPIAELDDGFMRPTYEGQVMVSYMQAGLVFEFIDIEYGFDKIVDILYQFNDKVSPEQAIENSLGISIADFDRHFKQFIDIEYGQLLGNLNVWIQDYQSSFEALQQQNWEAAIAAAERAIFTYPDYVEVDSPYIAKARAHEELEQHEQAFEARRSFWQKGGYSARALMSLADDFLERGDQVNAAAVMRDVNYADPFHPEVHSKLGELYLESGQAQLALQEFEVHMALDPLDKASANYNLARAHDALGDRDQSMDYLMTALDIAPQFRPAQRMLLELSREQN